MCQGQIASEKEILLDGFHQYDDLGKFKVFTKPNSILYWNTENSKVDRIYTYGDKPQYH